MGGPLSPWERARAAGARVRVYRSRRILKPSPGALRASTLPEGEGPSIRCKHFVHACAKLRTPLFEFVDALAILAAAEIIG